MNHRAAVLFCLTLCACATAPVSQPPADLFHDQLFVASSERINASDVFAVSNAMKRYLSVEIAEDLRAKGSTLAQIAQRVGLTRQAVHEALKRTQVQNGPAICRHCGAAIPGTDGMNLSSELMCRDCLDMYPRISFGVRLMSLRTLAGLTQSKLARNAGVSQSLVSLAEKRNQQLRQELRIRLLDFLESALARQPAACPPAGG